MGGDSLLGLLPPKPGRSNEQSTCAARIHSFCRLVRREFMELHTDWLYRQITNELTTFKSLHEVAFKAAELCPGLVPTQQQLNLERTRTQANKEGYEIDQGLLFHYLLRSPEVGNHLVESALRPTPRAQELIAQFIRDGYFDLGTVLLERKGYAAHLTINNPHCLNAEDDRLVDDMETAVDLALMDHDVRVAVLRGGVMTHPRYAGQRIFSAGINLKALNAGQISFVDFLLRRELGLINKIFRGLLAEGDEDLLTHCKSSRIVGKPWLAAVDGFAIGGGAQLLLVFDRVIATTNSYFSLPAAQEGIIPGFANLRLHRVVGSRKARQMVLFGSKVSACDPDAKLLVDDVVEPSLMDETIDQRVKQLGSPAVFANRYMLNLAEESPEAFLRYASEFSLMQAERLYSPDVLEKVWS
ncbi:(3,5-dihydroxyphenyl)acetyl-CoA 1,2-dioxygenase DpgC [Granulicella sp. L60]|uniref:(3,5-dihydroxyphenyl)acetyl-CoA 1,2-dioxygenase DpgC n=1 Tax=Granulicella sp. L60 TaxID=1641866 RepID=UPI00352B1E58